MAMVVEELAPEAPSFTHRFSWSATFAGAVVGTAVILFLLLLGAGIGLALVGAPEAKSSTFLTLGAIYFLAAQAMGFAAGGHIVGRLIGPMAETDREEEFRAAAHGLAVWGLCVTISAILAATASMSPAGSSVMLDAIRLAPSATTNASDALVANYWTDVLLRPAPAPMHASQGWQRYAQANSTATDAFPSTDDEAPTNSGPPMSKPMTPVPPPGTNTENAVPRSAVDSTPPERSVAPHVITIPAETDTTGSQPGSAPANQEPGAAAQRSEINHILEVWRASNTALLSADRERLAQLVTQGAGIFPAEAYRRVQNMEARIKSEDAKQQAVAQKTARNASLWLAFSMLFGAVVAGMAAISARWEDDRITFGWRRSEPA